MFNYPFFPFFQKRYNHYPYGYQCFAGSNYNSNMFFNEISEEKVLKKNNQENKKSIPKEAAVLEIFGLELCYDDILLICLLFFLYNEGVDDQFLFVALILLLLT